MAIAGTNSGDPLKIDWGNGFTSYNYSPFPSFVFTNYGSLTGTKKVVFEKNCFEDLTQFMAFSIYLDSIDLSLMKNLINIQLISAVSGNIYLSQFKQLRRVVIYNSAVDFIQIGFLKELQLFSISNISISSENLDLLFLEFWTYRKMYSYTPTIYIQALSFATSPLINSIINGTGDYINEGLMNDYGWTILIF